MLGRSGVQEELSVSDCGRELGCWKASENALTRTPRPGVRTNRLSKGFEEGDGD